MPNASEGLVLNRISSDAVRDATGRGWEDWLAALDGAGAAGWDHKRIVAHLEEAHPEVASSWWRQSITVAYEQARGKRALGQTAGAGFQLGVQRSLAMTPAEVWDRITRRPDLWLGEGVAIDFQKGARYDAPGGGGAPRVSGEVRVVKPGQRLRMTWHPDNWEAPATLQFTLTPSGADRTALGLHLEKLPDSAAREEMRAYWSAVLERIREADPSG